MSHLFYGVHEQSFVAHVMARSACLGPYAHEYDCLSVVANTVASLSPQSIILMFYSFSLAYLFLAVYH